MFSEKVKPLLFFFLFIGISNLVVGQNKSKQSDQEILQNSLQILRNYFLENKNWHVVQPEVGNDVSGLLHFIEDQSIDQIIKNLSDSNRIEGDYVLRLPENVDDSLNVPGYISHAEIQRKVREITQNYTKSVNPEQIIVPDEVVTNAEKEVTQIPEGKGMQLFMDSVYSFPAHLIIPDVIPDSILNSPDEFNRLVKTDSLRKDYVEQKRLFYNDSVKAEHIKIIVGKYREQKYLEELNYRIKRYNDSVKLNNYRVLKNHNDKVVAQVNDTIKAVINFLSDYADFVDTTRISLVNLTGDSQDILLQNGAERYSRVWLKNEQNDSLRVMIRNSDKRTIHMFIDDGVTFSRIKEKQTKDFDFESLKPDYNKFTKVGNSYELETPWTISGDGSVGLTQTYLENWKKGGQSALSSLIVLKGSANYSRSDSKVKWENSVEFRNGWIRPGGDDSELQKNDDKFELTTRYGLSAFKKWYYSAELNFNTQIFRGYDYPKDDGEDPISAFMAPAKTYLKFGLDYKPNKNLSLLLSPLTLKNVYVRDTSLVDQTKYSIDENKKAFWEPGLNADLSYKMNITGDITYETKYKMFINYQDPFRKFDLNWENLFKMQLNSYITMQFMMHFIYDDDVLFPIYADDGETKIGEETRLQLKEFFSIGFAYKINRKVMRTHRIR